MNHMLAATTDIHADRLTHTAHFHAVSLTSAHYSKQLATLRNVDKRNSRVAAAVAAAGIDPSIRILDATPRPRSRPPNSSAVTSARSPTASYSTATANPCS
jgi:hypothetical protein